MQNYTALPENKEDKGRSEIIGQKQLRLHSLVTGLAALLSAVFIALVPECPFDRNLAWVSVFSAALYLGFFAFFGKCLKFMHNAVLGVSFCGVVILAFVVHMTGGITSPLVCFYLAIIVSELNYGVTSRFTFYACAAGYLAVVLGEAYGFLPVETNLAAAIYANKPFFFFIAAYVIAHMAMTSYFGKTILSKLRRDFSEEQRERQAVVGKLQQLESFSQIGVLAHRIVHDLRGPLGAISGYMQLQLRSAGNNSADQGLLADMMLSVEKMTALLDNVSRFGRVTEGAKEVIRLREFFRSLLSIIGYHKNAAGVEIVLDPARAGDFSVLAVPQDLKQVYFNIIKNALEALEGAAGSKSIEISARQAGDRIEVSVVNNGPRVPEEILAGMFKAAVSSKEGGTGVGMLIARDLLLKNNASIQISNLGDTGVKVTTSFPRYES